MATRRGCGCLIAAAGAAALIAAVIGYYLFLPWWEKRRAESPPPASGEELRVHVLDVGQADAILIISPAGKATLVDAGAPGSGKKILGAMQRYGVSEIDLLIATHAHADHIGAADEVIKGTTVKRVLDSRVPNTTKNYQDFLAAIDERGVEYIGAEPGQKFELGGGAIIRVLAPIPPVFTKEQLRSGGNEPNANSVVLRLDYGEFSMLLTGDAEAQTEDRLLQKEANVAARVLKVGHHGSKYASSDEFLKRGRFEAAIISTSVNNRYGHPSQDVLDRLKANQIKVYRTDLQGEITITTRGQERDYKITTEREAKEDLWAGRKAQRDDSARSGFIQYGDFGPAPKENANANRSSNANQNSANRRAAGVR